MPRQIIKVGKYDIIGLIARGGMGAVYKARHPTLKRYVILKQLTLRGGTGFIMRFKREASLMIDFRNDHIVQVYDHFKEGSSYYIAMEYVDGISLDKLIEIKGYLSNEAAVLILAEICKGLKYAHDKEVIHRDIKPANILISREGEVKLVDFGIATSKEADDDGLTKAGMTLGTPAYMSPEQIADTRKVDKRADIYSMGVVLYEMITGEKPFPSGFTAEAISLINKGIYTKPQKLNPSTPGIFKHIIKKSMNHKVSKRYKDIQHILNMISKYTRKYKGQKDINDDIKKYLSGSEITFPAGLVVGKKKRSPAFKIVLGLIALAVVSLGGWNFYHQGYYYEYFKNREFGSIEIRTSIPEGYYKDPELIYTFSRLTNLTPVEGEDKDRYDYMLTPPGKGLLFQMKDIFTKNKEAINPEENILTTSAIYLPAGSYSLELYLENYKYYKTFYLNPRVVQKQSVDTYEKKLLQFELKHPESKPVSLAPRVYDSVTGESLYKKTDISFYLDKEKKWIDWKKYNSSQRLQRYLLSQLKSGKSYSFKFHAPSYYPETVRFYVESDLDSARLEVSLSREPGKLVIDSDFEGLELLIDNQKENYLGEKKKEFVRYGETISGSKEFMLPDGDYMLTVMRDKRHMENYQFTIYSKKSTGVKISYDKDNKKISILQIKL